MEGARSVSLDVAHSASLASAKRSTPASKELGKVWDLKEYDRVRTPGHPLACERRRYWVWHSSRRIRIVGEETCFPDRLSSKDPWRKSNT